MSNWRSRSRWSRMSTKWEVNEEDVDNDDEEEQHEEEEEVEDEE